MCWPQALEVKHMTQAIQSEQAKGTVTDPALGAWQIMSRNVVSWMSAWCAPEASRGFHLQARITQLSRILMTSIRAPGKPLLKADPSLDFQLPVPISFFTIDGVNRVFCHLQPKESSWSLSQTCFVLSSYICTKPNNHFYIQTKEDINHSFFLKQISYI